MVVASQPLQKSFPCLDAIPRDDSDRDAPRRRSSLGWAFARESPIATAIVRKDFQVSADSRLTCGHAGDTTAPPRADPACRERSPPTGSVPDITLVKPTKVAEGRITAAVVKAKLHVLACGQPWSYGAIANSNAGNTDQATAEQPPDDHPCPREVECSWGFVRGFRAAPCRDAPAETERRRTWGSKKWLREPLVRPTWLSELAAVRRAQKAK